MSLRSFNTGVYTARNVSWLIGQLGGLRGLLLIACIPFVLLCCTLKCVFGVDLNKSVFDYAPMTWEEFEHEPFDSSKWSPRLRAAYEAWKARQK